MNGGLPWRHRGPFPYWLTRWSQSDEESRDQMLPGPILLSPVSSVSTFTFVGLRSPPLRLISPAVWFLVFLDTVTACCSDWSQNTVSLSICDGYKRALQFTKKQNTGLNKRKIKRLWVWQTCSGTGRTAKGTMWASRDKHAELKVRCVHCSCWTLVKKNNVRICLLLPASRGGLKIPYAPCNYDASSLHLV